jgi:hypothetical protein
MFEAELHDLADVLGIAEHYATVRRA